jgi:C1A family cysteine protease
LNSVKRVLNWVPDLPDKRDLYLKVSRLRMLPSYVDLREHCTPIEDQGSIGSCSAQAFVANMEYLDRVIDDKYVDLSRLFVYYNTREDKGNDTGAYLRDGIKALAKYGACDESIWPYATDRYSVKPPEEAYRDGEKRRITEYRRIEGLKGIRQSLADGFPVVFGFTVYESFNNTGKDGMMPMPSGRMQGGHAVLAVGYDDKAKRIIVRNSWGKEWCDSGYFYMPYDYITDDLTADFWTVTRVPHPVKNDEPWQPDLTDVKWYIPLTTIWRVIKSIFRKGE